MITIDGYRRLLGVEDDDSSIAVLELDRTTAANFRGVEEYSDFFSYILVREGRISIKINEHPVAAGKDSLVIFSPRVLVGMGNSTDDFHALHFVADIGSTEGVLTSTSSVRPLARLYTSAQLPMTKCDEADAGLMEMTMRQIMMSKAYAAEQRKEIVSHLQTILMIQASSALSKSPPPLLSHRETLFMKFVELAIRNYRHEHGTRFYADALSITPVYLAGIVREFTQKSVKQFIARLLYKDARDLLNHSDKQVKEISEMLGFYDMAAFSNFFKNQSGVAPTKIK